MAKMRAIPNSLVDTIGALLVVAAATAVQLGGPWHLGVRHPFLVYYPAVAIAALCFEVAGGLTATALAALLADYFWIEPVHALSIQDVEDQVYLAVFLTEGVIITYAVAIARRVKFAEAAAEIAKERQQAAETLQQSEMRMRLILEEGEAKARTRADELAALMDTVPAITFIAHDPECRHMTSSRKTREFLKVPEGVSVSLSAQESDRPDTFRPFKDGIELSPEQLPMQMAAKGKEIRDCELTLLFQDGTSRDILGDAVPLYDRMGNVRGSIGAFLDITERNLMERELKNARDELEKRVEERTAELRETMKALQKETEERLKAFEELGAKEEMLIQQGRLAAMGEMINNIAHQWKQPLNTLGLLVQELPVMFRAGGLGEEYLNAKVAKARETIGHMSQTIDDFRDFFRPNKAKVWFAAKEVIDKTISLIAESFQRVQIEIRTELEGESRINGYPNELSQVLLNLFLNSRDAFQGNTAVKERLITVRTLEEGDKTVIIVSDNAGGIPEELLDRIFDPYFTTKPADKGTGLGLFLSRSIIEKSMNGKLKVCNLRDGVEFRIEI